MDCREFQNELVELMEGSGNAEQQTHLGACPECSALVQELGAICEQARQMPLEEPGPHVWTRLQAALEQEGLIREISTMPALKPQPAVGWLSWPAAWRLGAVAAMAVMAVGLVLTYQPLRTNQEPLATKPAATVIDAEDLRLLDGFSDRSPAMRAAYETSLKNVNAHIAEATKSVQENPNDARAREQLLEAYEQKAMVYEMAMSRSLD